VKATGGQRTGEEKTLRNIIVTMWMTLDGFTAGSNNELDWVIADEANEIYQNELVSAADTLLLGRVTYESFAGSWPYVPENPSTSEREKAFARRLNSMRKIVFSRSLAGVEWNNATLRKEVVPEEIKQLKQEPGSNMVIYGSMSLVQTLTNFGLIDEYQLLVHPVILGRGKPLFQHIKEQVKLKLVHSKPRKNGVVELFYRPDQSR
jgi:dihydrofolate reductase